MSEYQRVYGLNNHIYFPPGNRCRRQNWSTYAAPGKDSPTGMLRLYWINHIREFACEVYDCNGVFVDPDKAFQQTQQEITV